jgi:surface antigen
MPSVGRGFLDPQRPMPGSKPIAALLALTLAACVSDGGQTGTIAYSTTSSPASKVASAGVLGNGLGASLDERERQRAYAAEVQALEQGEPGEPVGWKGSAAGRHGTVVPGAYYETRGVRCRDYSHTIYLAGRPETARATACRNPDGTWAPVG